MEKDGVEVYRELGTWVATTMRERNQGYGSVKRPDDEEIAGLMSLTVFKGTGCLYSYLPVKDKQADYVEYDEDGKVDTGLLGWLVPANM